MKEPENGSPFLALSGAAVAAGGALTIIINAGLSPFLPADASYAETAASSIFLWRLSLAALVAVLLLFGSVGLYLRHAGRTGVFGRIAYLLVFIGEALLVAQEWAQVFFIRELALRAPDALDALEDTEGPNLFDMGTVTAVLVFTLGWIVFSISMLTGGAFRRRGPILVIAGFLSVPILGAALPGLWGQITGNLVLGAGWIALGIELIRARGSGNES